MATTDSHIPAKMTQLHSSACSNEQVQGVKRPREQVRMYTFEVRKGENTKGFSEKMQVRSCVR
jgi:hypothetical protein